MKTWTAMGPSGPMETMATTRQEAERNLRYRLYKLYGMSIFAAQRYDFSDLHIKE